MSRPPLFSLSVLVTDLPAICQAPPRPSAAAATYANSPPPPPAAPPVLCFSPDARSLLVVLHEQNMYVAPVWEIVESATSVPPNTNGDGGSCAPAANAHARIEAVRCGFQQLLDGATRSRNAASSSESVAVRALSWGEGGLLVRARGGRVLLSAVVDGVCQSRGAIGGLARPKTSEYSFYQPTGSDYIDECLYGVRRVGDAPPLEVVIFRGSGGSVSCATRRQQQAEEARPGPWQVRSLSLFRDFGLRRLAWMSRDAVSAPHVMFLGSDMNGIRRGGVDESFRDLVRVPHERVCNAYSTTSFVVSPISGRVVSVAGKFVTVATTAADPVANCNRLVAAFQIDTAKYGQTNHVATLRADDGPAGELMERVVVTTRKAMVLVFDVDCTNGAEPVQNASPAQLPLREPDYAFGSGLTNVLAVAVSPDLTKLALMSGTALQVFVV